MYKGFLSGILWGAMVGLLVLAVLSLYVPLPVSQSNDLTGEASPVSKPAAPEAEQSGVLAPQDDNPESVAQTQTAASPEITPEATPSTSQEVASNDAPDVVEKVVAEGVDALEETGAKDTIEDAVEELAETVEPIVDTVKPESEQAVSDEATPPAPEEDAQIQTADALGDTSANSVADQADDLAEKTRALVIAPQSATPNETAANTVTDDLGTTSQTALSPSVETDVAALGTPRASDDAIALPDPSVTEPVSRARPATVIARNSADPEPAPEKDELPKVLARLSEADQLDRGNDWMSAGNADLGLTSEVAIELREVDQYPIATPALPQELAPTGEEPPVFKRVAAANQNEGVDTDAPDLQQNEADDGSVEMEPVDTTDAKTPEEPIAAEIIELAQADTPLGVLAPALPQITGGSGERVVTGRLPVIGAPDTDTEVREDGSAEAPAQEAQDSRGGSALLTHSSPFEDDGRALFSIVIIDVGDLGVPRSQILNSTYPVTVALDPTLPNAAALEQQYRDAGIEVVALLNDLPRAAHPADVQVALSGYMDLLQNTVAVMDPLDGRLRDDRDLLQPVLGALTATGHGLLTYGGQGLNPAGQMAQRAGVPAALAFRVLDGQNERAPKIKRYLKRAAFNSGRDGSVVVIGRSFPETMTAILEWALESNDATMAIAPLSAILKQDLDGAS